MDWRFANDFNVELLNEHSIIVGIIGSTGHSMGKSVLTNNLLDRDVFPAPPGGNFSITSSGVGNGVTTGDDRHQEVLEVVHEVREGVLYLQLSGPTEPAAIIDLLSSPHNLLPPPSSILSTDPSPTNHDDLHRHLLHLSPSEFHVWLEGVECGHLKALLVIFHICHHIFVVHPRPHFDVDYLRIFRILNLCRSKMSSSVASLLAQKLGVSDKKRLTSTNLPGQFTPSLSFLFPTPHFSTKGTVDDDDGEESVNGKLKRFRTNLDAQITLLLKRYNICSKPTQALTRERERGSVEEHRGRGGSRRGGSERGGERGDRGERGERGERGGSERGGLSASAAGREGGRDCEKEMGPLFTVHPTKTVFLISDNLTHPRNVLGGGCGLLLMGSRMRALNPLVDRFLADMKRLRVVVGRNIDTVRKHLASGKRGGGGGGGGSGVVQCSGREWLSLVVDLSHAIFHRFEAADLGPFIDPDTKFSASRCARAMQSSKRFYMRELPVMYTPSEHHQRATQSLKHYHKLACGPAMDQYESLLRKEMDQVWHDGRQQCPAISATGRHCTHPIHGIPPMDGGETTTTVTGGGGAGAGGGVGGGAGGGAVAHQSGFQTVASCGCGYTRSVRKDPFDLIQANVVFYKNAHCCATLGYFPLHSDPANGAGWGLYRVGDASMYDASTGMTYDGFRSSGNTLLKWVARASSSPSNQLTTISSTSSSSSSSSSSSKDQQARQREKKCDPRNGPPELVGYVGLEYECSAGHRFIYSETDATGSEFPSQDVPLLVSCTWCEKTREREKEKQQKRKKRHERRDYHAQLQRLFLVTPVNSTATATATATGTSTSTSTAIGTDQTSSLASTTTDTTAPGTGSGGGTSLTAFTAFVPPVNGNGNLNVNVNGNGNGNGSGGPNGAPTVPSEFSIPRLCFVLAPRVQFTEVIDGVSTTITASLASSPVAPIAIPPGSSSTAAAASMGPGPSPSPSAAAAAASHQRTVTPGALIHSASAEGHVRPMQPSSRLSGVFGGISGGANVTSDLQFSSSTSSSKAKRSEQRHSNFVPYVPLASESRPSSKRSENWTKDATASVAIFNGSQSRARGAKLKNSGGTGGGGNGSNKKSASKRGRKHLVLPPNSLLSVHFPYVYYTDQPSIQTAQPTSTTSAPTSALSSAALPSATLMQSQAPVSASPGTGANANAQEGAAVGGGRENVEEAPMEHCEEMPRHHLYPACKLLTHQQLHSAKLLKGAVELVELGPKSSGVVPFMECYTTGRRESSSSSITSVRSRIKADAKHSPIRSQSPDQEDENSD